MSEKTYKTSLRLTKEQADKLKHFSEREGISKNEFIIEAIEYYINFLNHDFNIPDATVERLNQIHELFEIMSSNMENLERTMISGFSTITGLARGGSYLDEDEEL